MKRFFYFSSIILVINSSCKKQAEFSIPKEQQIVGLATPINLNPQSTKIFLKDYFPLAPKIDSISSNNNFELNFDEAKYELEIVQIGEKIPNLSLLNFSIKGDNYSILLKKSNKIQYTFVFPADKEYKSIQLMGEFNAWNPGNTNLKKTGANWETELTVEPGEYQYLVVIDGKQQLDPNNKESVSNNIGGFNSLLKVGKYKNLQTPHLFTIKNEKNKITLGSENAVEEIIILIDNQLLTSKFIKKENNRVSITIPEEASKLKRSYIRVWVYNSEGISNDLLIPLSNGKVISNVSEIERTDFEAAVLYNVFIDRFFDGNPQNTKPVDDPTIHPRANYHGGDIVGIIKKIEDGYFKKLGVNTIWVSPIVKNPEKAFGLYPEPKTTFSAYHGYWPISFTEIDERFGTEDDLHKLVELAHEKNMNVLLDFVANHVHEDHPVYKAHPDWATELHLPDGTLNTERWDTHRLTTWFDVFLPTLDLTKPEVYEMLSDSAVYWIEKYNLDGFRHDATKHVPEVFWRTLTQKLKAKISIPQNRKLYQIGETYGTPELISSYVSSGQLDAQFDFNVYDALSTTLASSRSFKDFANQITTSQKYYGSHHLMGNITGNQDRARFISYASGSLSFDEDSKKAGWTRNIEVKDPIGYKKCAMLNAVITTIPGLPVIYYGDEIGMPGGNDPDNRRMMRFDNLDQEEQILKGVTEKLLHLRKNSLSLIYGDMKIIESTDDVLIYQRSYFDKVVIVALNKSTEDRKLEFAIEKRFNNSNLTANFGNKMEIVKDVVELQLAANSFEIIVN